ncbi:unnamed protein product, partial [Vitis vinifera]|uniref:Uncharacterized protein n=1 Tax=Vitis vinifera TaxID=29760 RepID=D7T5K0_VITVI
MILRMKVKLSFPTDHLPLYVIATTKVTGVPITEDSFLSGCKHSHFFYGQDAFEPCPRWRNLPVPLAAHTPHHLCPTLLIPSYPFYLSPVHINSLNDSFQC